jgi:hypothetical protein
MAVLSDVSEQVRRERQLRQNDAWLNALLTSITDYALVGLDARAGSASGTTPSAASPVTTSAWSAVRMRCSTRPMRPRRTRPRTACAKPI